MQLYSARVCPYAHRTRLALLEKSIEFELIEIDLGNPPAQFLRLSPYGKVPAIVDQGETIYESDIINEYLDESRPAPALLPGEPLGRARARIWIDYCNDYFTDDHYALLKNRDPARLAELLARMRKHFEFIEHQGLARTGAAGPYWLGADLSLVDLAWYPFFERLPAWTHYRGLELPAGHPRLRAWLQAMSERPSVRAIANPAAFYIEHYAGYAGEVMAA